MKDNNKHYHNTAEASCIGKVRIDSFEQAQAIAGRRRGDGKTAKGRAFYRCAFCDGYHMGVLLVKKRQPPKEHDKQRAQMKPCRNPQQLNEVKQMGKSQKPRKAYRGGRGEHNTTTMQTAVRMASLIDPQVQAGFMEPVDEAFELARTGRLDLKHHTALGTANDIACDLSADKDICTDGISLAIWDAWRVALACIKSRARDSGSWVAKGPELDAIRVGVEHHRLQISLCTLREYIEVAERRLAIAKQAIAVSTKAGEHREVEVAHG